MAAAASPVKEIHHHNIQIPKTRPGCPCILTPFYSISTPLEKERRPLLDHYTPLVLVHEKKTGELKNELRLAPLHRELEIDSLALLGSGASNMLLSKVSFDCLIVDGEGREVRDYLSFDLRIPGAQGEAAVFSYDFIEAQYGSKESLYSALRHLYITGRKIANPEDVTHGCKLDYALGKSSHDQYIRHTEQLLAAYLATPAASVMLSTRLQSTIRAKYPGASRAKAYNMGLHMHSTKSCCAPCEYVLLGLMNDVTTLNNFQKKRESDLCPIAFPKKSPFRLVVTVTASQPDATHQSQPTYTATKIDSLNKLPLFPLFVRRDDISRHIFQTMVMPGYDARRAADGHFLADKTVAISGSLATPGSPKTIAKVKERRSTELSTLKNPFQFLEDKTPRQDKK